MSRQLTAVSLFTSGGLGDLALRKAGFDILVSNELQHERHAVFAQNFPATTCITGDIWQQIGKIMEATIRRLRGEELDLLYATPPCQGMSKNGRGKLLTAIRAGNKPPLDERNRLIIPTIELAKRLRPQIILLENVPEMADTVIVDERGEALLIIDYVKRELGNDYVGAGEVVEFADYGVPQRRQRLISVFARAHTLREWFSNVGTLLPEKTHSEMDCDGKKRWVSVRSTIADLPALDARDLDSAKSPLPFHRVPVLDAMKHWWVSNTPPTCGAFDNQCVECGFQGNQIHVARRNEHGINRTSKDTPVHCQKCGALLPRPSVERDGRRTLMSGFTSAYKRMAYDKPASALTRNLSYACSDNKLHPEQNRVLSLYEAFRIHTLDQFAYAWERADGKPVSDKTIREIIGESIPPAGFFAIVRHLVDIYLGRSRNPWIAAGPLFAASHLE